MDGCPGHRCPEEPKGARPKGTSDYRTEMHLGASPQARVSLPQAGRCIQSYTLSNDLDSREQEYATTEIAPGETFSLSLKSIPPAKDQRIHWCQPEKVGGGGGGERGTILVKSPMKHSIYQEGISAKCCSE